MQGGLFPVGQRRPAQLYGKPAEKKSGVRIKRTSLYYYGNSHAAIAFSAIVCYNEDAILCATIINIDTRS